jgi:acyl-CoA thioesterase FadM
MFSITPVLTTLLIPVNDGFGIIYNALWLHYYATAATRAFKHVHLRMRIANRIDIVPAL